MKISKLSLMSIVFVVSMAFVGFGSAASGGNGAIISKNFGCGIYTGDYGTQIAPDPEQPEQIFGFLNTENSILVINKNNWQLTCRGKITENFPTQAVSYTSTVGCQPFGPDSIDSKYWHVIISPSGEVTLTCLGTIM